MAFDPLSAALNIGDDLIKHFFPNPADQAKAKAALLEMQQKGELQQIAAQAGLMKAQLAVDQAEAAKGNLFIAGWRPGVGWVCAAAFGWTYIGQPVAAFALSALGHPVQLPTLDLSGMMPVLMGMLGLGGYRTFEKLKGVNQKHG